MPRTPEAQAFFHAVYSAVQEIPPGKVTSYGHIAKLVGTRMRPSYLPFFPPPSPDSTFLTHSFTHSPT
jgi:methylated-DNA-protein-cysteine methyltransferase-like protein